MSDAAEGRSASDRGNSEGGPSSRGWGGLDSGGWGGTPSWGGEVRGANRAETNAAVDAEAANSTEASRQAAIEAGSHQYAGFAAGPTPANLEADEDLAKAMWRGLTREERDQINEHLGRPAGYGNSDEEGSKTFKDKLFDMTNPGYKSKAYALGIRGMGATMDTVEKQESLNPNLTQDRFNALTGIAKNLADLVTPAPMKAAMTVARAIDAVQNDKMTAVDAVKNAMFDIGMGPALGMVNKAVYGAIGPDAYSGYSAVNKAIGLANLGGANVPTVNSAIAGGVRNALGITGFGPQTGVTDASGAPANPAGGSTYEGVGGGWGRTDSGTVSTPTVSVPTPTVSVPGYDYQSSRTDLDGTAFGRYMRNNVINRFSRSQP